MRTYKCTHCGAEKQTDYPPGPIDYHHKACSDAGYYNRMEEVPDRVRRQEEARGWHRLSEAQVEVVKRLAKKQRESEPRFHLSEGQRSFLNKVRNKAPNMLAADVKEYEHDRRLRGQYE